MAPRRRPNCCAARLRRGHRGPRDPLPRSPTRRTRAGLRHAVAAPRNPHGAADRPGHDVARAAGRRPAGPAPPARSSWSRPADASAPRSPAGHDPAADDVRFADAPGHLLGRRGAAAVAGLRSAPRCWPPNRSAWPAVPEDHRRVPEHPVPVRPADRVLPGAQAPAGGPVGRSPKPARSPATRSRRPRGRAESPSRSPRPTARRSRSQAAEECVQLHGGIGFTWEHPAHLYLKRAKSARSRSAGRRGTARRSRTWSTCRRTEPGSGCQGSSMAMGLALFFRWSPRCR